MLVTLVKQHNVGGGNHRSVVILYTYYIINRHAGTLNKAKTKYKMSLDYSSICYIGPRIDRSDRCRRRKYIQVMDGVENDNGKLSNNYSYDTSLKVAVMV